MFPEHHLDSDPFVGNAPSTLKGSELLGKVSTLGRAAKHAPSHSVQAALYSAQ